MSKINTPPRGLQDWLGNVNQGDNPSDLSQQVSPGIDIFPFTGVDKMRSATTSASTFGIVGQTVSLSVPNGEIWIPIAMSASWFAPVGATRRIHLEVTPPSQLIGTVVATSTGSPPALATEKITAGVVVGSRWLIPTGWRFVGFVEASDDASASNMTVDVVYYRIKA